MALYVEHCRDLEQVERLLASDRNAHYFGGGTLLMRAVNEGTGALTTLIRSSDPALSVISASGTEISIGCGATMRDILDHQRLDFLHAAARSVGSPALRNMATVGGNLFARAPYGDFATALLALDAQVEGGSGISSRRSPLSELHSSSSSPFVRSITFRRPETGNFRFLKVSRVHPRGAAIMTLAAHLPSSGGRIRGASIAYGGIETHPVRAKAVERALEGQRLDDEGVAAACRLAAENLSPITDALASSWYRQQVLPVHLKRLLLGPV